MAKIAVLIGEEFEDSEFTVPCERLKQAGHQITILGSRKGETVKGKRGKASATIGATAKELFPRDFDALLIPGGHSPDHLRTDPDIVSFTKGFVATGRLVAAVCHGPQLLIEADAVKGRRMTSWPSVRKDLLNAGAEWADEQVVESGNFITSRKPDDLKAFSDAILRRLS